jgi:hypothetical protein
VAPTAETQLLDGELVQPGRRFAPTRAEEEPSAPGARRWDMCRVRLRRTYTTRYYVAEQTDAWGPVRRSPDFRPNDTSEARDALEALMRDLADDGWALVVDERGEWDGRFRRERGARA